MKSFLCLIFFFYCMLCFHNLHAGQSADLLNQGVHEVIYEVLDDFLNTTDQLQRYETPKHLDHPFALRRTHQHPLSHFLRLNIFKVRSSFSLEDWLVEAKILWKKKKIFSSVHFFDHEQNRYAQSLVSPAEKPPRQEGQR